MNQLQQLKGMDFAIEVENNLEEINEKLIETGFIPDKEWNDEMVEDGGTTYVIVYESLEFAFHNHHGGELIRIKLQS